MGEISKGVAHSSPPKKIKFSDLRFAYRTPLRNSNRFRSNCYVLLSADIESVRPQRRDRVRPGICDLRSAPPLRKSNHFRSSTLTVMFFCRQIPNQCGDRGGTGSGLAGCSVPHHLGPPAPHQDGSQVSIQFGSRIWGGLIRIHSQVFCWRN
jgi:hypothetical protein